MTIHLILRGKKVPSIGALIINSALRPICPVSFVIGVIQEGISTETHHFFVEWAAAGAIDSANNWSKVKHFHNLQTGKNIGAAFDWSEVAKNPTLFVDSPENMVVLCEEHHRSSPFGIHHSTFPEWILQAYAKQGFHVLSK